MCSRNQLLNAKFCWKASPERHIATDQPTHGQGKRRAFTYVLNAKVVVSDLFGC